MIYVYHFAGINENILLGSSRPILLQLHYYYAITITALFAQSRYRIVIPLELTRLQSTEDSLRARTKRQNPGD